ncbi:kinase-like protein, partial [Cryphonectria parasitica EP155]
MSLEPDWQRSLAAHRQARSFNHPNIIRPLAAIVRNPTAYLMYEWADGGNLRDYWRSNRRPDLTPRFIKLMVEQLRGLADALETLHNSEGGSYRHGDIKPENILRLRGEGLAEAQADLGVLKLSGFGIARYHEEVTAVRHSATTTMSSPRMYEAPGAATSFNQPRSRRYDIWSMGCVILEFIAWALYGHDGLEVMDSRIAGDFGRPSPLYVIDRTGFANTARLHPEVNTIMNVIAADRECRGHTALGDLLRLVRDRLLVVNLSLQHDPTGPSERQSAPDFEAVPPDNGIARADAGELRDALETIIRRGNVSENYWFTRTSR